MFNYRGDLNGQRNLPGAPMLDPLMGMLFVLGFALAVRRWREWPNRFMLLTFAAMLLAGILSADWEAPQALRVIGVIPPIVYFCALALLAVAMRLMHCSPQARTHAGRLVRQSRWCW